MKLDKFNAEYLPQLLLALAGLVLFIIILTAAPVG